jgi:hypothetical protein
MMNSTSDWQTDIAAVMEAGVITQLRCGEQAEIVAHPLSHACVLTLWSADSRTGLERLMRARWDHPARLGAWLPAQLADGQPAWLAHVPTSTAGPDWPATGLDLDTALEHLA